MRGEGCTAIGWGDVAVVHEGRQVFTRPPQTASGSDGAVFQSAGRLPGNRILPVATFCFRPGPTETGRFTYRQVGQHQGIWTPDADGAEHELTQITDSAGTTGWVFTEEVARHTLAEPFAPACKVRWKLADNEKLGLIAPGSPTFTYARHNARAQFTQSTGMPAQQLGGRQVSACVKVVQHYHARFLDDEGKGFWDESDGLTGTFNVGTIKKFSRVEDVKGEQYWVWTDDVSRRRAYPGQEDPAEPGKELATGANPIAGVGENVTDAQDQRLNELLSSG